MSSAHCLPACRRRRWGRAFLLFTVLNLFTYLRASEWVRRWVGKFFNLPTYLRLARLWVIFYLPTY
jgi:hypothetical protein